ncbi:MAG: hypothetical protein O3B09_00820 [Proteobacteria bacterium]|nr:hypothetical protein [Pseudomonadota bacterium]
MTNKTKFIATVAVASSLLCNNAFAAPDNSVNSLKKELDAIKSTYEKRISDLETKLSNDRIFSPRSSRNIYSNRFNPSIGVILNGKYANFSKKNSEIAGFGVGEEGEREAEHFSLGESELNFSSSIDDKFFGSMTAIIVREDGADKIELEEAFVMTTPGLGLPTGLEIKAGRSFWKLGYLNEHHAHTDDFADRPLPYRAFLNRAYNDDGVQLSYLLPTDFFAEIGGGTFRGGDYPFGEGDGTGQYLAYARFGGDLSENQNIRIGLSVLSGEATGDDGRVGNEDEVKFIGKTDLYAFDLRYNFAPTGNAKNQELILQGEYFLRDEEGTYEDTDVSTGKVDFDGKASGWYAQAVYKFHPQWRVGARYSQLISPRTPVGLKDSALDANGHNPESYTAMIDWTNSEFSRIRVQYTHEEVAANQHDNQVVLQYIMSFGAHGAHIY